MVRIKGADGFRGARGQMSLLAPIFYVPFVSTKPTALSSCVTVMSQVTYE